MNFVLNYKNFEMLTESLSSAKKDYLDTDKIEKEDFDKLVNIDPTKTKKYLDKICEFYYFESIYDISILKKYISIYHNLIEKQLKMEEIADRLDTNKNTVQETLAMLAKEFQKLNRNKQNKEAIDVNFKELDNAVHEEREEGLQTGSSSLHLETRGEEEAS